MAFVIKLMTSQTCLFIEIETGLYKHFSASNFVNTFYLHLKFGAILSQTYKDMTLYPHMYQNVYGNLLQKNVSIQ